MYTLPSKLRDIAYQNKRVLYDLLMKAAAETTLAIAADPKRLGARIGVTAVLHTWGSALTHHPHVHMIVPGGGLSLDGARWVASRSNFLVHVNLLARLFSGKMLAMLTDTHDADQLTFWSIEIRLLEESDRPSKLIAIPWSPQALRRKREVIQPSSKSAGGARPIRAEARRKLLSAIAKGRRWLDEMISSKVKGIEAIAAREGVSERSARMGLSLAFLAPDIVQAAVDGILPRGFGVSRLIDMPPSWAEQRQTLGIAPNH